MPTQARLTFEKAEKPCAERTNGKALSAEAATVLDMNVRLDVGNMIILLFK
jgi:hypothetical protein